MNAADSIFGKITWAPWIIGVSGVALFLVGSLRFASSIGFPLLTPFIVVSRLSQPDFFYSFFPMSFNTRDWHRVFLFSWAES